MASNDEASQVAELKPDNDVVNPRSEAKDYVDDEHQHDFIEVLGSASAWCLVHPAANDHNLRDDLAYH